MKILHVLNELNICGNGIVNFATDLAASQRIGGEEVAVASPKGTLCGFLSAYGIRHYDVESRLSVPSLFRAMIGFRRTLKDFAPDVVHCHMMTGLLIAKASRRKQSYTLVTHVHNIHQKSSRLMGFADHCIAVSEAVKRELQGWGVPEKRISVVPNFTLQSPRREFLAGQTALDLKQPAVVTVAGLNKRKNIDGLIRAFEHVVERHPNAHLYLVGDGPDRNVFESQANVSKTREQIHFEGFQADPTPYLRAATVFVLASHRESFGLVLHEAREQGVAIVATDVDGIPEALDHGAAGILVRPGDSLEIAGAICSLLENESKLRHYQLAARQNLSQQAIPAATNLVRSIYDGLRANHTNRIDGSRDQTAGGLSTLGANSLSLPPRAREEESAT